MTLTESANSPSIRALAHTYLLRAGGRIVERPQYLYMRVAIAAHGDDIDLVLETYDALSRQVFTPASPVLFNASTCTTNYASCFVYTPNASDTESLLDSARELDKLWLADGGVGLFVGAVPAKRSVDTLVLTKSLLSWTQNPSCPPTRDTTSLEGL